MITDQKRPTGARRAFSKWVFIVPPILALATLVMACAPNAVQSGAPAQATISVLPTVLPPSIVALQAVATMEPTSTSLPAQASATAVNTRAAAGSGVSFIKQVILAADVQGDNYEPVGVTTTFTPDQKFHAIVTLVDAPTSTHVRAVWFAVDVGNAAAPNSEIGRTELSTDSSRNVDFVLRPSSATWPAGTYRVEIYGNDQLADNLSFSVSGAIVSAASPTPAVSSGQSTFIDGAVLAKDVAADTRAPVNITTTFAPIDSLLHFVVHIKDAPDNTEFGVTWYFGQGQIDAGGGDSLTVGGTHYLDFQLRAPGQWDTGDYHVNLFVNGNFDRTLDFQVQ